MRLIQHVRPALRIDESNDSGQFADSRPRLGEPNGTIPQKFFSSDLFWLLEAAALSPLLPAQHEPKPTV